jgi:hypothetical protein
MFIHVYFWSDEQNPLEPVHIHISKGSPTPNATKYWINGDGTIEQENNNSRISPRDLKRLERTIKKYTNEIIKKWEKYFGEPAKFHDQARTSSPADDVADDFGDR